MITPHTHTHRSYWANVHQLHSATQPQDEFHGLRENNTTMQSREMKHKTLAQFLRYVDLSHIHNLFAHEQFGSQTSEHSEFIVVTLACKMCAYFGFYLYFALCLASTENRKCCSTETRRRFNECKCNENETMASTPGDV